MKITITRGELKIAVNGFQKIVNGKSRSLPILGGIRFESDAAGVAAHATDLDQFLTYAFAKAQTEDAGVFIIPLTTLKDLAKGRDEESVEFACAEDKEYTVSVTNHVGEHAVQHSVPGFDLADWPASPTLAGTRPATGFLDAYRSVLPFVSRDETRRVLNGVYIEKGTGDACTLVATDGRRLTCRRNLELPVALSVVVPATKFLAWSVLPEDARIGLRTEKDGKTTRAAGFVLQTGPWRYDTRTIDGTFPNWRQVVPPGDCLSQRIVFHEDDVGLMRRVLPTFPGGESVSIACGADGNVTLAGRDRETGDETRLPLQGSRYTGPGSRICLDRVFLQEAFDAGFRAFGFADSHAPLMAEDGQGGTHVLMPLRVTGEPRPVQSQEPAAPEAASETPIQQPETAQPQETAQPEPEHPKENPKMNHENQTRTTTPTQANVQEPTALEKLQAAYETARNKVREAQSALADVAIAIRDAAREDRQRRSEVESVRAGLQKLQAIRV